MTMASGARARGAWIGGVVAGLVGGVAISLLRLLSAWSEGKDLWVGLKLAGAPLIGLEQALAPGFEAIPLLTGLLFHLVISLGWGLLFGLLFWGFPRGLTLFGGLCWGNLTWLVMSYAVLPLSGVSEIARLSTRASSLFEHLIFGLALALGFLPFQRLEQPRSIVPA